MYPQLSFEQARAWATDTCAQLTLEEKCRLIGGKDVFFTQGVERLGIKPVMFSDATAGVVLRTRFWETTFQNATPHSTAFPAPIMLASTWNPDLAEQYASSIADQCRANGIGVLLGPGFNLYRISQCGRNFEYFGEDPHLISSMVERYVKGVQEQGVISTLKHFLANNTDYFRRKSNSVLDERTMREIYLPAFEAGIAAGALAVMTSYNLVNGEWTGESKKIIHDLLREELGFKWLVMSDWWSVWDCEKVLNSGQDLEMPASDATADAQSLIEAGELDEALVDRMVTSLLTTFKAMNSFEIKPEPERLENNIEQHRSVALQTAREGTVLLHNRDNFLPIQPNNYSNILLLGDYVEKKAVGGGSSFVRGNDEHTLLKVLSEKFVGSQLDYSPNPSDDEIKNAPLIILSIGTQDAESWDRPFELNIGDERYVERILSLNSNVVVLVNSGSGIRMTDWYEQAAAVVYCWYNGYNGNYAVAEILQGLCNPSGKLPMTIEKDFADSPGAEYIPEGEAIYFGENDAWEAARDVYDVEYEEGVFVGYRWYEAKQIEPLFPFGFGLSYTNFSYSDLNLAEQFNAGETVSLSFKLTNSGQREGMETAQIYVRDIESTSPRPIKELKAFKKLNLNPGESQTIEIQLEPKAFAFWSELEGDWCIEAGEFEILIGSSSADIHLQKTIRID